MMTEEEAKTKWCPFARFARAPGGNMLPNRSENMPDATRCLGSGCMAWRWINETQTRGYCGIAGRPA